MDLQGVGDIENSLQMVGELLAFEGREFAIVILGGAAINLLGIVDRSTADVDIVAFAKSQSGEEPSPDSVEPPPVPIPDALRAAARRVASDLGLGDDWLNTEPALQWLVGLPPGMTHRIRWTRYSGLWVGVVDRYDLIFFKLFAAADSGAPNTKHYRDLVALNPSKRELAEATRWVETQDASPAFGEILMKVVTHVSKNLGID